MSKARLLRFIEREYSLKLHNDVIKMEKISALLAFFAENSPVTVYIPTQSQWRADLIFYLIYAWNNGSVNNETPVFKTPSPSL